MLLVVAANVACSGRSASAAAGAPISLGEAVTFLQSAVGVSMIAFGGLNWALDGAAAPVAAVLRLRGGDSARWRTALRQAQAAEACPRVRSAFAT